MIECGIPIREVKKYFNFDFSDVVGCLLTHNHGDHAKAAKDIMKAGVDLYCSQGTANALKLKGHRLHIVQALKQFQIGEWVILPFEVEHDAAEPLGYLIVNGDSKVLFATDTYYVHWQFNGLTHICIECNYSIDTLNPSLNYTRKKRLMESHMGLHTLVDFFKANDLEMVEEIHLLHLSDENSDENLFMETIQRLTGKPVFIAPKKK